MTHVREVIESALREIQEQQGYRVMPLLAHHRVVKDLGFSSMDVAQLIAVLEMELDVDPFGSGISIMSIHTIGDLCQAYQNCPDLAI